MNTSTAHMNTVQIFKGRGRQPWYIRVVSPNGQILNVSEGYYSLWNAKRAAKKVFPGLPLKVVR